MTKIIGVTVCGNSDMKATSVSVSYNNGTKRKYLPNKVPRTVYAFCMKAKNREGIEFMNGRMMTAYW